MGIVFARVLDGVLNTASDGVSAVEERPKRLRWVFLQGVLIGWGVSHGVLGGVFLLGDSLKRLR